MDGAQVHFEVFARRQHGSSWSLELATEDRTRAIDSAEEMLAEHRAISVKVSKETLDEETREFKTVTILTKGEPDRGKAKKPREGLEPLCVSPHDLYSLHARDRIGRLLEGWLARARATPFELLHRADLIEKLEATGLELQHAIQKVAIPEAQARGKTVHHVIRDFQKLVQATIDRVMRDDRKGRFHDFETENFAAAAERLVGHPDQQYRLGGGVAKAMSTGASWSGKVNRLLDLADQAPREPAARALAFHVLEQPLTEILGARAGIMELLGVHLDLGGEQRCRDARAERPRGVEHRNERGDRHRGLGVLGVMNGGIRLFAGPVQLGGVLFLQAVMELLLSLINLGAGGAQGRFVFGRPVSSFLQTFRGPPLGAFSSLVARAQHLFERLEEHVLQIEMQRDKDKERGDRPQQNPTQGVQGCFHLDWRREQTDAAFKPSA